jgi:hypothetical protein
MKKYLIFVQSFLLTVFVFYISSQEAQAARLYLSPGTGEFNQNDIFITQLRIDTENQSINLGEINIKFPQDYLSVIDVSSAKSIFSIWPQIPVFENKTGVISLIGGSPNGFTGDGQLAIIAFKALKAGVAQITMGQNVKILLNDGLGTQTQTNFNDANFNISSESPAIPKNEWENTIKTDNIPPDIFKVKVQKIDEKYFAIFSTHDEQSGIDHYEIMEGKGEWKNAASPYFLEDQHLKSKISVKAFDAAGNQTLSEFTPINVIVLKIIIVFSVVSVISILVWLKFKKKKNKK